MQHLKQCSFCAKKVFKLANPSRGLCAACYYREKRNGSLEYIKVRKPCAVNGCEGLQVAKGYCDKHYRRFMRDGDPLSVRAEHWGHAQVHPLYDRWRWICRRRSAVTVCPEWKDDFWQFQRDVGEPPSIRHTLRRIDERAPFGPRNFIWREPHTDVLLTGQKATHAEYMRAYRLREPKRFLNIDLKKNYGITLDQYESMLAEQDGVCAICRKTERNRSAAKDSRMRRLAVDHCHDKNTVRGLLCSPCNTLLGLADDDPEVLRSAIAYLTKHAGEKAA